MNLDQHAKPYRLPETARGMFGRGNGVPWDRSLRSVVSLAGVADNGGMQCFPIDQPQDQAALFIQSWGMADTDGPGGSIRDDSCWQPDTSLRWTDGKSCDSRRFMGVVISPLLTKHFGVSLGDFAMVWRNGILVNAQVYDIGPKLKQGEFSVGLLRALGLNVSGRIGHDAHDIFTVIFPRSFSDFGGEHPVACSQDIIDGAATTCWRRFTGRAEQ